MNRARKGEGLNLLFSHSGILEVAHFFIAMLISFISTWIPFPARLGGNLDSVIL